ncbi:hypothetical protein GPJ56_002569 [Histomonas meleagridis]|uniref:uncharacterized protein n=1 Tax=Histomonas meleagridis TaxID=135588 RepID=UPI003559994B|nr:hypothetical protein GPJ56_002569 [Histomonas meleagridis]KAH0801361.1 hypothetical protein GO595_005956 [Histomonas meleagridis]
MKGHFSDFSDHNDDFNMHPFDPMGLGEKDNSSDSEQQDYGLTTFSYYSIDQTQNQLESQNVNITESQLENQQVDQIEVQLDPLQVQPSEFIVPVMPILDSQTPTPRRRGRKPKSKNKKTPTIPKPKIKDYVPSPPQIEDRTTEVREAIEKIPKDKLDFFLSIFETPSKLHENDRISTFISIATSFIKSNDNSYNFFLYLVEEFCGEGELYQILLHPRVPVIFNTSKTIIYRFTPYHTEHQGFEIQIPKGFQTEDVMAIGSFIPCNDTPHEPIIVGSQDVECVTFGEENVYYYVVKPFGSKIKRAIIRIGPLLVSKLCWFVITFAQRKPIDIVFDTLKAENKIPESADVQLRNYVYTKRCIGCRFDLKAIIEHIENTGSAKCPTCGAPFIWEELLYSDTNKEEKEMESFFYYESMNSLNQEARYNISDCLLKMLGKPQKSQATGNFLIDTHVVAQNQDNANPNENDDIEQDNDQTDDQDIEQDFEQDNDSHANKYIDDIQLNSHLEKLQ